MGGGGIGWGATLLKFLWNFIHFQQDIQEGHMMKFEPFEWSFGPKSSQKTLFGVMVLLFILVPHRKNCENNLHSLKLT